MKLYDFALAPNPRRLRIYLAEKGLAIPRVTVNLRAGEQRARTRRLERLCEIALLFRAARYVHARVAPLPAWRTARCSRRSSSPGSRS